MYLIDTNCLSEFRRIAAGRADYNVAAWAACVSLKSLYLSAISIFEVQAGISRIVARDPDKARSLTHWLEGSVLPGFEQRILPIDQSVARAAGRFAQAGPIETGGVLMAATALVRDLTLVTRNTSDFERTGVPLLNPWIAAT
jgi:predicted nucleic acid-binding protein